MIFQQIVEPARIEPELFRIWEGLRKENKMRASLFNLIIFSRYSSRTDYVRNIVQKVVEKFPCRSLFISHDPDSSKSYLKTAISVVTPGEVESDIACDQIDIGVAGSDLERIPFLILPHLIPDLPIYLLWAEDPSQPNPLFDPLTSLATRVIFDSESADSLLAFAETILTLKRKKELDIADLNWARTEGWRDLITSIFNTPARIEQLKQIYLMKIVYNSRETQSFCHLKIQAMYLLAWISSRLGWRFQNTNPMLHFQFEDIDAKITSMHWEKLGPGTVISTDFYTTDGHLFEAARIQEQYHHVKILISSPDHCDLPYQFVLGQTATGHSLVKEICTKGTSSHYLAMLEQLKILDRDNLC